jgi:hypothetical protein
MNNDPLMPLPSNISERIERINADFLTLQGSYFDRISFIKLCHQLPDEFITNISVKFNWRAIADGENKKVKLQKAEALADYLAGNVSSQNVVAKAKVIVDTSLKTQMGAVLFFNDLIEAAISDARVILQKYDYKISMLNILDKSLFEGLLVDIERYSKISAKYNTSSNLKILIDMANIVLDKNVTPEDLLYAFAQYEEVLSNKTIEPQSNKDNDDELFSEITKFS